MADTTGTPPAAANAGTNAVDLGAILKELQAQTAAAIAEAIKPFTTQLADLQKGQQAVQDAVGKAIKPDDVQKAVAESLKAQTAAAAVTAEVKAKKDAARAKAVEAAGIAKLDPTLLASLPDTDDEKSLTDAATKIAAAANALKSSALPDVGGTNREGGTPAGAGTDGGSGGFLKMPA